jgi:hypothetical protein
MKARILTLILATPMAMILLLATVHFSPSPADARPPEHGGSRSMRGAHLNGIHSAQRDAFSERIAGSYLVQFGPEQAPRAMKFQALITLHADGSYSVNNQAGQSEHGNWKRSGKRQIKGAGLTLMSLPDGSNSYLRNKVWTIDFDDSSLSLFTITISEADIVPGDQDPLDPETAGFPLPGPPLPFTGRGEPIPAGIE